MSNKPERVILQYAGKRITQDAYQYVVSTDATSKKSGKRYQSNQSFHGTLESALVEVARQLSAEKAKSIRGYVNELKHVKADIAKLAGGISP